ncbi:MAG: hypothetical protein U0821_03635 [Chloroflexota bacterium]
MVWMAPLKRRPPAPDDYLELGHQEDPRVWIPAWFGMILVVALLLIATMLGKL